MRPTALPPRESTMKVAISEATSRALPQPRKPTTTIGDDNAGKVSNWKVANFMASLSAGMPRLSTAKRGHRSIRTRAGKKLHCDVKCYGGGCRRSL